MNGSLQSVIDLVEGIKAGNPGKAELAVCPPAVFLMKVGGMLAETRISLGAQNVCDQEAGAFTGEISAAMLKECGCQLCDRGPLGTSCAVPGIGPAGSGKILRWP